jgi:hypothetical protein
MNHLSLRVITLMATLSLLLTGPSAYSQQPAARIKVDVASMFALMPSRLQL